MDDDVDLGALLDELAAVQPVHQVALADSHMRASSRIEGGVDRVEHGTRIGWYGGLAEGGVG